MNIFSASKMGRFWGEFNKKKTTLHDTHKNVFMNQE
jgi:hypothetical protein